MTTEPNELCAAVHDRMPVILRREDYATWLGPGEPDDLDALRGLLGPYPAERTEAVAVGRHVGNARHEGPQCVQPLDAG